MAGSNGNNHHEQNEPMNLRACSHWVMGDETAGPGK
jgi:hypothetical protein